MDVHGKKSDKDCCGPVQENAGHLKVDGAVSGKPYCQGDGSHKEEHAAQPQTGVREIMAEKVGHKVDHIGSLGISEEVAEAQDRIDPEKTAYKGHHIMKGSFIFFLVFHLCSPFE